MHNLTRKLPVAPGAHSFPDSAFGSINDLLDSSAARSRDTLLIACAEQGTAPDNISILAPERVVVLQHICASIPSQLECQQYDDLSCHPFEQLFAKCRFRHVIVCGHLKCQVIPFWLQPQAKRHRDPGQFRQRFENGTRALVNQIYAPESPTDELVLLICEHVLCQIENLLTHRFVQDRVRSGATRCHGWVVDDETARVFATTATNRPSSLCKQPESARLRYTRTHPTDATRNGPTR